LIGFDYGGFDMMRHFVACVLALCVSEIPHSFAQNTNGSTQQWAAVTVRKEGEKLDVRLKDGGKVEGVLADSSETGLTLRNKAKSVTIERANIRQLYVVSGRSKSKAVALGAGVGAGGGAIIGAATTTDDSWLRGAAILMVTAAGAIVGVVTGLFLGRSHRLLIYQSA
jgi:hypothetical protein